jgi:prolyl-tRNA synthetase
MEEAMKIQELYADFVSNEAAIPVIPGRKSEGERFPGAVNSYTIEAMMSDGRALQCGTTHFFGQNFAKAFNIQYQDENGKLQYCWTTSWGVSTRLIGAIIMTHGDDQGLILPPRLAPIQLVIVPIYKKDAEKSVVMEAVEKIKGALGDRVRLKVDDRDEYTPGWKFNEWELRGAPLRIEVGPRDVAKEQAVLARRDQPGAEGKSFVPLEGIVEAVVATLDRTQTNLLRRAMEFRDANTYEPTDYESFKAAVSKGFARAWWAGDIKAEEKIKEDASATLRCIPIQQPGGAGKCIVTGKPATEIAIFARTY